MANAAWAFVAAPEATASIAMDFPDPVAYRESVAALPLLNPEPTDCAESSA